MTPRSDITNTPNTIFYSDLTSNFAIHPATKDLFRLTNINAVKQSVYNLLMTDKYEHPFQPNKGCNLRALLFENISADVVNMAVVTIKNCLSQYEPRISNISVQSEAFADQNGIVFTIYFDIINIASKQSIQIPVLSRAR